MADSKQDMYFFTTDDLLVRWVQGESWDVERWSYRDKKWVKSNVDVHHNGWGIDRDVADKIMKAKDFHDAAQIEAGLA